MKLLLDTTILIDLSRQRPERTSLIEDLVKAGHELATTAINIAEVYAGLRTQELGHVERLMAELLVYPITPELGRRGGELKNAWTRRGRTLALDDALIAAVAIAHGLPLLTDNQKDFPMPELRLWPLPA